MQSEPFTFLNKQRAAFAATHTDSFRTLFSQALEAENLIGQMPLLLAEQEKFATDTGYKVEPEQVVETAKTLGLPTSGLFFTDFVSHVKDSVSQEHYEYMVQDYQRALQIDRNLGELGLWGNMGIRALASFTDPVFWAPSAITWRALRALRTTSRLGRAVVTGVGTGLEAGLQEAVTSIAHPSKTHRDVVYATALGLTLGTGIGAVGKFVPEANLANANSSIILRELEDSISRPDVIATVPPSIGEIVAETRAMRQLELDLQGGVSPPRQTELPLRDQPSQPGLDFDAPLQGRLDLTNDPRQLELLDTKTELLPARREDADIDLSAVRSEDQLELDLTGPPKDIPRTPQQGELELTNAPRVDTADVKLDEPDVTQLGLPFKESIETRARNQLEPDVLARFDEIIDPQAPHQLGLGLGPNRSADAVAEQLDLELQGTARLPRERQLDLPLDDPRSPTQRELFPLGGPSEPPRGQLELDLPIQPSRDVPVGEQLEIDFDAIQARQTTVSEAVPVDPTTPIRSEAIEPPRDLFPNDSAGAERAREGMDPLREKTEQVDLAKEYVRAAQEPGSDFTIDVAADPIKTRGSWFARNFPVLADLGGRLTTSESPSARALGYSLTSEHLMPNSSKMTLPAPAMLRQQVMHDQMLLPFVRIRNIEFEKFMRLQGHSRIKANLYPGAEGQQFMELAGSYHRGTMSRADLERIHGAESTKSIVNVVEAGRQLLDDYRVMINSRRMLDDELPLDSLYFPRYIDEFKVRALIKSDAGTKAIERWIAGSLRGGAPELSPKAIEAISHGYTMGIVKRAYGVDDAMVHGLKLADIDEVESLLRDARMKASDIAEVTSELRVRNANAGTTGRLKHRVTLDETVVDPVSGLKYDDIFMTDYSAVLEKYNRDMSGSIALYDTIGIQGTRAQISDTVSQLRARMVDEGVTELNKIDHAANALEALLRIISGKPADEGAGILSTHPMSVMNRTIRGLRNFNFTVMMPQAGFASLGELGMPTAIGGHKLMLQSIPEFRRFITQASTGEFNDDLIEFFAKGFAPGSDSALRPHFARFADVSSEVLPDPGRLTLVERGLNSGQRLVAEYVSLLGPLTSYQRNITTLAMFHRLEKWALQGTELTPNQIRNLRDLGLNSTDLRRIRAGLDKHRIRLGDNAFNRPFDSSDLDAFAREFPEETNKLFFALSTEANRRIVSVDAGVTPLWVMSPIGRLMTQFMTFVIGAHTKLFLRGVTKHDFDAFTTLMWSFMFATMAVAMQKNVNTIGRPEARAEEFSNIAAPGGLLWQAWARTGQSALVPNIFDSVSKTTSGVALFNERTSGLPFSGIFANASVSTGDNLARALGIFQNISGERQFNQSQARAITGLIPILSKMVGGRALTEYLIEDLPTSRSQEE